MGHMPIGEGWSPSAGAGELEASRETSKGLADFAGVCRFAESEFEMGTLE